MSSGFLSKFAFCNYILPSTLFPLILIVIILITLAFPFVRQGELRVTAVILSRMLHVFFVGPVHCQWTPQAVLGVVSGGLLSVIRWRVVRGNSSSITIFHILRHHNSGTDNNWAAT